MRDGYSALAIGVLGALLLPGALVLVACLLWAHARRYRYLHGHAVARLAACLPGTGTYGRPGLSPGPP
ncbi:MAG: hypothetical protein ACYC0F_05895 [Rhodanobacter sp.]